MNYKYLKFLMKKAEVLEDFYETLGNKIVKQVEDAGCLIKKVSFRFDTEYDIVSIYFESDWMEFEIEVPATDLFPISKTVSERIVNELSYEKNKEI